MNKSKPLAFKMVIPWLFVLPGLIFTAFFRYYPIIRAIWMSLFKYDIANPPGVFIWFKNYIDVIKLEEFKNAWINTLWFLLLTIILTFFIPIIQAIFLSEIRKKARRLFNIIYIIPALIPISVNVILWKWIWNPQYGIANFITNALGLGRYAWLSDAGLTKFCIIFPGIIGGGVAVLLYLAAILAIPKEILEAAQIDGCTGWQRIFYIVLPNIKFLIMIQFVTTTILILQLLDQPLQFTHGGPAGASTSVGLLIYKTSLETFSQARFGRSSAIGMILFVFIAIATLIYLILNRKSS